MSVPSTIDGAEVEAIAIGDARGILTALILALALINCVCKISWEHHAIFIGTKAIAEEREGWIVIHGAYAETLDADVGGRLLIAISTISSFRA